ncbi:HepT-like ribonuclease domain-containing protein [uncultured Sphaerotilus sp.]|uniref:HepT-like ribonuclease domain-containing protein n=1 Tax=uncultured Sphaerotilus sp. TaxID=474984 RepID=UPI0030CA3FCC
MSPDARTFLCDAIGAARLALSFVQGRSFADYQTDAMLRSAVERQLFIVGEALGRLRQIDPGTAARIPDLPRAVGLRNILAQAYSVVDDAVIWGLLSGPLDKLIAEMEAI